VRWNPGARPFFYTHMTPKHHDDSHRNGGALRAATAKQLIVGRHSIHGRSRELHALKVDAVVGMAIYSGRHTVETSLLRLKAAHLNSFRELRSGGFQSSELCRGLDTRPSVIHSLAVIKARSF